MGNFFYCIQDVELYSDLSEDQKTELAKLAQESVFDKEQILYSPIEPAKYVYILKEGEIELYREEGDKTIILESLFSGDIFGNFGSKPTQHFAKAKRKSLICRTPRKSFMKFVTSQPEVAKSVIESLTSKLSFYEEKIGLTARTAKDRVLHELKFLQSKQKKNLFGKLFRLPLRISHQRLAEKTGLNRVTVTKILGELKDQDVISIEAETQIITIKEF